MISKIAFKYYVKTVRGVKGLIQKDDTDDAGEGGGLISDKMLTLGSEVLGKLWRRK